MWHWRDILKENADVNQHSFLFSKVSRDTLDLKLNVNEICQTYTLHVRREISVVVKFRVTFAGKYNYTCIVAKIYGADPLILALRWYFNIGMMYM